MLIFNFIGALNGNVLLPLYHLFILFYELNFLQALPFDLYLHFYTQNIFHFSTIIFYQLYPSKSIVFRNLAQLENLLFFRQKVIMATVMVAINCSIWRGTHNCAFCVVWCYA